MLPLHLYRNGKGGSGLCGASKAGQRVAQVPLQPRVLRQERGGTTERVGGVRIALLFVVEEAQVGERVRVSQGRGALGSFLFYFCAVHAVRHTLELPLPRPARSWGEARARFVLGLPLSLTVIAIGGAAWTALPGPAAETGVRVVFQGLLALTLPHIWLHARTDGSDAGR
ncbi:MAG TPA: Brp/Blh family beta-carotene 15,15'-dioxygenase [Vicinamibacteria bacterium]|nr:Brp/Blh family beta-carotene 15,15'-dioxygenase [Vicinamibacteria bacterium]